MCLSVFVCVSVSQKLPGWKGGEKPSFPVACTPFLGHFLTFSHHYRHPSTTSDLGMLVCLGRGEHRVWAGQNNLSILAGRGCGLEGPCVGVAGKAQQSCGFGRKPAPGVGELLGPVKLTLEGRESWSMTPVLMSSLWSQKQEPFFCHRPRPLRFTLCNVCLLLFLLPLLQ